MFKKNHLTSNQYWLAFSLPLVTDMCQLVKYAKYCGGEHANPCHKIEKKKYYYFYRENAKQARISKSWIDSQVEETSDEVVMLESIFSTAE